MKKPIRSDDYDKGYKAGYQTGYRAGLLGRQHLMGDHKNPAQRSARTYSMASDTPERVYDYMIKNAPDRGGYMFEGVRDRVERGEIIDKPISELLRRGWIKPHPDPGKGWVPVPLAK